MTHLTRLLASTKPHTTLLLKPHLNTYSNLRRFFSSYRIDPAMEKVNTTQRLEKLRELMQKESPKVDVYIVPSEDAHSSEYIAPCDARRQYISGFNGSAGCAVITLDKAALSTDGRYFNQASKQLDDNWTLLKQGLPDVPTWQDWACEQAQGGKSVGVDATLITARNAKNLEEKIKKKGGAGLVALARNLVDDVWGSERPPRPAEPIIVLGNEFAGKPFSEKLQVVRGALTTKKSPGFVVSMLDEVMWLYNIRGSDIPYNPVSFSYAVITPDKATLYVDDRKVSDEIKKHLEGVEIRPYNAVFEDCAALSASIEVTEENKDSSKWLVSNRASWALVNMLGGQERVEVTRSPIEDAKAVKNETELKGMRNCHIRDGAALIEYFAWLEDQLLKGAKLDEVDAAIQLEEFRKTKEHFKGLSFATISSSGANAAVIHYHPMKPSCAVIDPKAIYLCDSGAQYLDGTTDTTRTLHFGEPIEMEKKAYTLVLKGHIALSRAIFPKPTTGIALDVLARQFLWAEGLDYRHGTGHGVGSFLNVHEGPIGIGTRPQYAEVSLSAGNVVSNEPGYYEDGAFGIRIENLVAVKETETKHKFGDRPYFGFEHLTMVPMCKKLTDIGLLTPDEKEWLNAYHAEVYGKTKCFFEKDSLAMKWLERETTPIADLRIQK
ncbi:putative Xaa-Pro aminopeptidase P [Tirmania nivea]|nr:putative Xaa-Pro aminopeptidase P [Tirmania nivea]